MKYNFDEAQLYEVSTPSSSGRLFYLIKVDSETEEYVAFLFTEQKVKEIFGESPIAKKLTFDAFEELLTKLDSAKPSIQRKAILENAKKYFESEPD